MIQAVPQAIVCFVGDDVSRQAEKRNIIMKIACVIAADFGMNAF